MATYLVHIEFKDDSEDPAAFMKRLTEVAPLLDTRLDQIGSSKKEIAYRSHDGRTIGYFVESNRKAHQVLYCIDAPPDDGPAVLRSTDKVWVIELGISYAEKGYPRPAMWLDKHGLNEP